MASQSFDRSHRSTTTLAERRLRGTRRQPPRPGRAPSTATGRPRPCSAPCAPSRPATCRPSRPTPPPAWPSATPRSSASTPASWSPDGARPSSSGPSPPAPPTARWPCSCRHRPRCSSIFPGRGFAARRAATSPPSSRSTRPSTRPTWWSCPTPTPSPASSSTPSPWPRSPTATRRPPSWSTRPTSSSSPSPAASSLVGTDADNVIVLRSVVRVLGHGLHPHGRGLEP